jgi:hypothetical protein
MELGTVRTTNEADGHAAIGHCIGRNFEFLPRPDDFDDDQKTSH